MKQSIATCRHKFSWLPYAVLMLGIVYLCFLASSIQPDVFFQGDGGMKFMVVKQVAAGGEFKNIHLSSPGWVDSVWQQGFFPIKKPFLYPSAEGYTVSFPPGFQIVSAVLYKQFGYQGLYIIPVCSILLLWVGVLWFMYRESINPVTQAVILAVLIFCSPATLYGVTYWEHVPAILLLFAGAVYLLQPRPSVVAAVLSGFLSGLAVWLRPEAIVMNGLFGVVALVLWKKEEKTDAFLFVAGMLLSVAGFFIFNKAYYHSFLGVHGYQVLDDYTIKGRVIRWGKNLLMINWLLIKFFPFILLLIPVFFYAWKRKMRLSLPVQLIILVIIAFCILAPAVLPNTGGGQWGPRYFLPVIPLAVLALIAVAREWKIGLSGKTGLTAAILLGGMYAGYLNSYKGGVKELRGGNYNRITPALRYIRSVNDPVIVISSEHIAMELGAIFKERYFFLAEDKEALRRLREALKANGVVGYLYIQEFDIPPGYPNKLDNGANGLKKIGTYYFGRYDIHDNAIAIGSD